MKSNCGRPRVPRAASVMAVVALALALAPTAHAQQDELMWESGMLLKNILGLAPLALLVPYAAAVAWVGRWGLRAAAKSTRPREDKWAAWSLILGLVSMPLQLAGYMVFHYSFLVSLPLWAVGPFALWTGIKAYRMGGTKGMADAGMVLGGLTTLPLIVGLLSFGHSLIWGNPG